MATQPERVPLDVLMGLTDTGAVDPQRVPCIATALREARNLVGRRPSDGRLERPQHGVTWAGALVYLIYCEQIGSCFKPARHSHRRRRGKALSDALVWFAGFPIGEADDLEELRNRLAHDYTLRGDHPSARVFGLHGSSQEPVLQRVGQNILVGLPALALRIETELNLNLLLLAEHGELLCHCPNGLAGVHQRYWMAILGPSDANGSI